MFSSSGQLSSWKVKNDHENAFWQLIEWISCEVEIEYHCAVLELQSSLESARNFFSQLLQIANCPMIVEFY